MIRRTRSRHRHIWPISSAVLRYRALGIEIVVGSWRESDSLAFLTHGSSHLRNGKLIEQIIIFQKWPPRHHGLFLLPLLFYHPVLRGGHKTIDERTIIYGLAMSIYVFLIPHHLVVVSLSGADGRAAAPMLHLPWLWVPPTIEHSPRLWLFMNRTVFCLLIPHRHRVLSGVVFIPLHHCRINKSSMIRLAFNKTIRLWDAMSGGPSKQSLSASPAAAHHFLGIDLLMNIKLFPPTRDIHPNRSISHIFDWTSLSLYTFYSWARALFNR